VPIAHKKRGGIMSATTKSADATKKGNESSVGFGQAASAQNGAGHSKEAAQTASETVAEAADTVTAMPSKMVERGYEAMMTGVRTAADVGGHVADISFDRGHHLLSSTTQIVGIYRNASEQSAGRIQALFSSWMAMSRGFQQMPHAWLSILDHAAKSAVQKPQDILRCKTMVEVAEVQRNLYNSAINQSFELSNRLFELVNLTAQDAARPLRNQL
jgi:hypothetical protein